MTVETEAEAEKQSASLSKLMCFPGNFWRMVGNGRVIDLGYNETRDGAVRSFEAFQNNERMNSACFLRNTERKHIASSTGKRARTSTVCERNNKTKTVQPAVVQLLSFSGNTWRVLLVNGKMFDLGINESLEAALRLYKTLQLSLPTERRLSDKLVYQGRNIDLGTEFIATSLTGHRPSEQSMVHTAVVSPEKAIIRNTTQGDHVADVTTTSGSGKESLKSSTTTLTTMIPTAAADHHTLKRRILFMMSQTKMNSTNEMV